MAKAHSKVRIVGNKCIILLLASTEPFVNLMALQQSYKSSRINPEAIHWKLSSSLPIYPVYWTPKRSSLSFIPIIVTYLVSPRSPSRGQCDCLSIPSSLAVVLEEQHKLPRHRAEERTQPEGAASQCHSVDHNIPHYCWMCFQYSLVVVCSLVVLQEGYTAEQEDLCCTDCCRRRCWLGRLCHRPSQYRNMVVDLGDGDGGLWSTYGNCISKMAWSGS